jgi:hypothetical protein
MPTGTTNYNWQKPDVGASADAWGGLLNTDLDGIDSTVKSVSNAIPAASAIMPVMNGTAAVGTSANYSREDHVHPTDTSRYAASNPSGYQTAAQVTASLGSYLPLAGGTLTGALNGTSATFSGSVTTNAGALYVNAAAGNARSLIYSTGGSSRWILMANPTAEAAGNAGSDLQLNAFDNSAGFLSSPLVITRSTGFATFSGATAAQVTVAAPAAGTSALILQKGGSGQANNIWGKTTGGSNRWVITLGDTTTETGTGNTGSNFSIANFTDAGAGIANPLLINRANSVCTFSAAIVNGPSDARLKENIAPLEGSLDKVLALKGVSFNLIASPEKREVGLIAQDVQPIVPEIIQDFQTHDSEGKAAEVMLALDYPKLTALLIEAVKTLTARVQALEAARG